MSRFIPDWADASYEKGETQAFYNEFFEVFGKRRRDVARYEEHVKKLDNRSNLTGKTNGWKAILNTLTVHASHAQVHCPPPGPTTSLHPPGSDMGIQSAHRDVADAHQ